MFNISILVDDPKSWLMPYAVRLAGILSGKHAVRLFHKADDLPRGDMAFLLGCKKLISPKYLARNKNNLVVHESDLPRGRGWSPVSWQVERGRNVIPVVLFEATESMDAGPIYMRDRIKLRGNELLPEIKAIQGQKTIEMVLKFVRMWPHMKAVRQKGRPTYFRKRTGMDNRLDADKTISEQFDKLKVGDNEKFPSWFMIRGRRYRISIHADRMITRKNK